MSAVTTRHGSLLCPSCTNMDSPVPENAAASMHSEVGYSLW